jgi:hypothetical protein
MIYKIIRYFSFFIYSTNQHSVHSPIVYKLITECVYVIEKKLLKRNILYLQKIINNKFNEEFSIHYIEDLLSKKLTQILKKENSIYLIANLKKKNQYNSWKKLIKNQKIQVSIDFYYFGIIILKSKKLQKQDYKIRL